MFEKIYSSMSNVTITLVSLSVMLLAGFLVTRLTKLCKFPNVTGYIIAGILIGPSLLGAVPQTLIGNMSFVSDIALAFIAFGVGKFFKLDVLKATGKSTVVITLFESMLPGILVFLMSFFIFGMDLGFSLVLGAISTATAPASTMMTINQYHARGHFVDTLLQTVALDDAVCLLVFSVAAAVASSTENGSVAFWDIALPILYNIAALIVGALCGFILSKLLTPARSKDNRLILAVAMLLGISGVCSAVGISPLLSCMVFGAVYINLTSDSEIFHQINGFTPPIFSLFFIVSGMNLDLNALKTFGLLGFAYFIIRIVGKYIGAFAGCAVMNESKNTRNYLGFALIPQAGVAIGLAFLGSRLLPAEMGQLLLTVILASSVLYELVGPVCAKFAILRSGSVKKPESEAVHEDVAKAAREALAHIRDKV